MPGGVARLVCLAGDGVGLPLLQWTAAQSVSRAWPVVWTGFLPQGAAAAGGAVVRLSPGAWRFAQAVCGQVGGVDVGAVGGNGRDAQ